MFAIKYKNIWFAVSALLVAASIWAAYAYGFNLSVDFKGGTLTEVHYEGGRPDKESVERWVGENDFGNFSVRPAGETGYVVRTRELNDAERDALNSSLALSSTVSKIERQTTVGPTAGAELQSKATKAIVVVVAMIVIFITFAFRKVSEPVASWKYGLSTVISLVHDVIVPAGVFIVLGHFYGFELDLLFVTGLLAVLGYSVHDTIVVFDRIRENLRINQEQGKKENFEETVGKSVSQTIARSINTSLTLLITLAALYAFGPSATEAFSLLLIIGLVAGTYSSIFLASPILVSFYKFQKK